MKENQSEKPNEMAVVEGELIDLDDGDLVPAATPPAESESAITEYQAAKPTGSQASIKYIAAPSIFLFVTLFGGMRLSITDNEFLFLKPALICLIFAVILIVLFVRARLIRIEDWFSESFPPFKNIANAGVMLTLFSASTQVFNSLIPEQGLPFWIVAFFFFWSLWTNLFAAFDTKKLLVSLGSLFGLAFVAKYLVLAGLTSPSNGGFIQAFFAGNITKEAFTYLLDLPKFSGGTGYIQFFTLGAYLVGLIFISPPNRK